MFCTLIVLRRLPLGGGRFEVAGSGAVPSSCLGFADDMIWVHLCLLVVSGLHTLHVHCKEGPIPPTGLSFQNNCVVKHLIGA